MKRSIIKVQKKVKKTLSPVFDRAQNRFADLNSAIISYETNLARINDFFYFLMSSGFKRTSLAGIREIFNLSKISLPKNA